MVLYTDLRQKKRSGMTNYKNLFIAGTDQGYVGIVGAMLGGIAVANNQILKNFNHNEQSKSLVFQPIPSKRNSPTSPNCSVFRDRSHPLLISHLRLKKAGFPDRKPHFRQSLMMESASFSSISIYPYLNF